MSNDVTKPTAVREFPVLDADGTPTGETRRWRTVKGTGNCCENYLAADPDGTLYDMGGDLLRVSPDAGDTWHEVGPPTPYPVTSEGCVTAAPNGDVCAIDWNPYSPDRVIAYKWVAAQETWYYTEVPLHTRSTTGRGRSSSPARSNWAASRSRTCRSCAAASHRITDCT